MLQGERQDRCLERGKRGRGGEEKRGEGKRGERRGKEKGKEGRKEEREGRERKKGRNNYTIILFINVHVIGGTSSSNPSSVAAILL